MKDSGLIICCRCNVKLEPQKVRFSYLGCDFANDLLKCPKCGQVYVTQEMAENKMSEVEKALEGK